VAAIIFGYPVLFPPYSGIDAGVIDCDQSPGQTRIGGAHREGGAVHLLAGCVKGRVSMLICDVFHLSIRTRAGIPTIVGEKERAREQVLLLPRLSCVQICSQEPIYDLLDRAYLIPH